MLLALGSRRAVQTQWPRLTNSCTSRSLRDGVVKRTLLTEAHDRGPSEPPLFEQTVPEHFAGIVSKYGDRPAVITRHPRASLTYSQLDEKSNALARGLQGIGVKKGDRVSVSLGNNLEFAIATYAIFKLGAILNPLNPSFNATQVVSALNHLDSSHLIIGAETHLVRKDPRDNTEVLKFIAPGIVGGKGSLGLDLESERCGSLRGVVVVDNSRGTLWMEEGGLGEGGMVDMYGERMEG
ncbi:Acyl-CoA ligase SID4 [Fulvia fulva]|uniref:Acyl-CoA ligase SID4 n=1 Tax=Passalora fulva TaxID=5499 RepID=A0A9Q8LIK4_PASFU|nr:Acyl-CoA ligase SID4 [Fulvia fulva]KAK4623583.1 Acyl-CoA ligase SID4 [Fulvia fulva]KAK4625443.1 Acyl-CoA ligase SID4 [Fulvia fulva]UJO18040.1 Acyl-CoA ligase SID4 [Fulvia fulva]WPV14958.1 Acyl-CoA ligase SID4 [Fulvia fulva]WPV30216.1 Acyl-CoA ligase SID4 [Fulvia fulva]